MRNVIVVGLQHGDEGKGKLVDYLTDKHKYKHIVRFNGGPNAGHTVYIEGKKYITHMIPTGILVPNTKCYIGQGCVVNPIELVNEIKYLEGEGISVEGRLFIDKRVNFILPEHVERDIAAEQSTPVGSTKKGIAPCYADKYGRKGVSFLNYKGRWTSPETVLAIRQLEKYVIDVGTTLSNLREKILFEGAQGTALDIDSADYPNVTSSHCTAPYAMIGSGIGMMREVEVIGVIKCYLTKVGTGDFPSSIEGTPLAEHIRSKGKEFGATTGRPRKIGWINLDEIREAIRLNGVTSIALLKNDVLDADEVIKSIGVYEKGQVYYHHPWKNCKDSTLEDFIAYLENKLNICINYVGTGPNREDLVEGVDL